MMLSKLLNNDLKTKCVCICIEKYYKLYIIETIIKDYINLQTPYIQVYTLLLVINHIANT